MSGDVPRVVKVPDLADPKACCGGIVTRWELLPPGGVATAPYRS